MQRFFKIIAPLLWALVIFLLSNVPGKDYPQAFFDFSWIAHLVEFFILGFLTARAFGKYNFKKMILALVICLLFALSDELHQSFVVFRSVSFLDWVVDLWGVVLGIRFYWKLQKLQKAQKA